MLNNMARSRSAEATIKGFNYQFDATIKMFLEAKEGEEITIEGIEDIDVENGTRQTESVQCKYYAGTDLSRSVFRDTIKPMLEHYAKNKQKLFSYTLYGYFQSTSDFHLDNVDFFKSNILSYSKKITNESDKTSQPSVKKSNHNISDDLNLTNDDLEKFLKNFKFIKTSDYDQHKTEIKNKLCQSIKCSLSEVEHHYYPNAQSLVYETAIKKDITDRKIKASDFIKKITAHKKTLFNHWYLEEKGIAEFCKKIRDEHFSPLNISPYARFFLIECQSKHSVLDIKNIIVEISNKWSSHRKRRVEPSFRYAPYIFLRNLDKTKLNSLLNQLYEENFIFVDGFPYKNASFSLKHITQNQTDENKLSLRFIEDITQLNAVLMHLTNQTKEVYDFFATTHMQIQPDIKTIHIPFREISNITNII